MHLSVFLVFIIIIDHAPVVSRAPARRQDIGGAYHAAPVDANQPVFLRSEINWNTYK